MKAVVLTCDKYIKLAEHTILTYEKLWKNNPFTFRVPYNSNYPNFLKEKYGEKIELVKTESPIKQTVLTLLADLDDEEWIYWCMDDRYLVRIKDRIAQDIYNLITTIKEPEICCILLILPEKHVKFKLIKEDIKIVTPNGFSLFKTSRKSLWRPQFLRVKVIRRLFSGFPDYDFAAKEMDSFTKNTVKEEKCYVPEKNLVVVGESTHRGELTENCASSFKKFGLEIPKQFNITKKYMLQGELPYQFLGFEFTLPQQINWFINSLNRWYWRNKK